MTPKGGSSTVGNAAYGTMGDYRYLPCPTCGARNGSACYTPSGDEAKATHIARRRTVEALWERPTDTASDPTRR